MDISHLLAPLNDAQRQAVCADAQQVLVLAGAGSGKTRVLTHRMAYLVETGQLSPYALLAVTFTNKAARELRSRFAQLLRTPATGLWLGTFHGLAHRLLRIHWQEAGLTEQFQILDADDQLRLIKRVLQSLQWDDSIVQPKAVQGYINTQKDQGLRAAHCLPSADVYQDRLQRVYREYERLCHSSHLVDFGELLLRAHELWLQQPKILQQYQQRFAHVLVDEFQDINTIQYAWLRVLCGSTLKITVVGDDDQSIYGWRGAQVDTILRFSQDFPQTKTLRLEQNYRSTAIILDAANHVIAHNSGRLGKQLWTDQGQGNLIRLYAAFNEQDEAQFVADSIDALLQQGESAEQIALLYRSNAQSRVLEEALIRHQIPYRIYGGQRFYERLEIKNALAYLRLLINLDDDAAIERIINTPARSIGAKTLDCLRRYAREHEQSLWQALCQAVSGQLPLTGRARSSLAQFQALIQQLRQHSSEQALALGELTRWVIERTGLIAHHQKEKGEKAQARIDNLHELVSAATVFVHEPQDEGSSVLAAFVDQAVLDSGEQQAGAQEQSVQLMTLHSAKGLEFAQVFLTGLEEGLFPHKMSLGSVEELQEERRLCYVGITRAMRQLTLTYAESQRLHGLDSYNRPSRFIREIPTQWLEEVRLNTQVSRPLSSALAGDNNLNDWGIALGARVQHSVFGEGVVLGCEGCGPQTRVEVRFDRKGSKWLMLQYAKLVVVQDATNSALTINRKIP